MTADQVAGMNLFFGKSQMCKMPQWASRNCAVFLTGKPDMQQGVLAPLLHLETPESKGRGGFTGKAADLYKFKNAAVIQSLKMRFTATVATSTSIEQVIRYINTTGAPSNVLATQLAKQFVPLNLNDDEIAKLVAFVKDALYDPNLSRYAPASLPSGDCIPNNDAQSKLIAAANKIFLSAASL